MSMNKLPALTDKRAVFNHFPTPFQNFIFRNWESIPTEALARVLSTDTETVEALAKDLGLRVPAKYNEQYKKRGYITVIRNNWHLLPYSQLLELLGWDEERLAFTLKEDDFLIVKLGSKKPVVAPLKYRELTDEEKTKTAKIKENLLKYIPGFGKDSESEDFDFIEKFGREEPQSFDGKKREVVLDSSWGLCDKTSGKYTKLLCDFLSEKAGLSLDGNEKIISLEIKKDESKKAESHSISITKEKIEIVSVDEFGILKALQLLVRMMKNNNSFSFDEAEIVRDTRFDIRFIHSYCALFGDPFLDGGKSSFSDSILKEYSEIGINGVWLHSVLYKMCEFPWDASISDGWQERLKGLRELCDRCEKYGIKVYLYTNEPRSMPKEFFDNHPELLGQYTKINSSNPNGDGTLCTSTPEVQKYLYDGIRTICEAAPNLGGFFTITASENPTNCYTHSFHKKCECKRCSKRTHEEVFSEVNAIIKNAAMSVNPEIEVIAYDWAWHIGDDKLKAVEMTAQKGVRIMCVSEEGVSKDFGCAKTSVLDYSISHVGPGETAKKTWKVCKENGGKCLAKVQFNNSWECSTVPYLPVYDLIKKHIEGICENGVDGLMLSWSLGGYPSLIIKVVSKYFFGEENKGDVFTEIFGDNANAVKNAMSFFSRAFSEYPFTSTTAYLGPHQSGPSNLLFEKESGLSATMTCFPYDDINAWRSIFTLEVYEEQMRKLSEIWKDGLVVLDGVCGTGALEEFKQVSIASYCLLRSSFLQIKYNRLRNEFHEGKTENREEILSVLDEEMSLAVQMYEICSKNSTIGYEAANHYFFNKYSLAEKVVNIQYLREYFAE